MQRALGALAALLLALGAALGAHAGAPASRAPEGIWQGVLQSLHIVVHIERGTGGALTATMDSPDQGAMGLAIDTVSFTGDSLRFEMRRLRAAFAGAMSAAGDSLTGTWQQGGFALPLALRRTESAPGLRRPQEPHPPYPYDTVEVSYPNAKAGIRLAGTLTLPRGSGASPCVIMITGSGAEDRDETVFGHRPFRVIADHLTRNGIAVLRVDDRGVGGSTGSTSLSTSDDFAGDVLAGISFLEKRKEIDPKRIGLIGHSEGGLIAPLAATRSKKVAFIVLMAGPGLPGDSILILQSAALQRLGGAGEDAIARESAAHRRVHALIRQGADTAAVVRAVRELIEVQVSNLPADQRGALGDLDSLAARSGRQLLGPWMRYFIAYDPRPVLSKVRCPVLAINGGKDFQVPPRENLDAIRAALEAGGNADATVEELPGLNHLFQTAQSGSIAEYARIEETIAPAALDTVSRWITAHTRPKR
jgi:hypothetical protein